MAIDKTINLNVNAKKAIKDTKELKEEVQGVDKAANESQGGFFNMAEGVTAVGIAFKAANTDFRFFFRRGRSFSNVNVRGSRSSNKRRIWQLIRRPDQTISGTCRWNNRLRGKT